MSPEETEKTTDSRPGRWVITLLILGLYLTLRGYHSLDGDQAYRLPLLLHRQDPALYATDPFVRAFDAFNPHHGSLLVLDGAARLLGLPGGLLFLFILTFLATCRGIDILARAVWRASGYAVGWVAIALVLVAKAGNIGTNHLFEAMLLDRLMALALGWLAIASIVSEPGPRSWRAALPIGLATVIHPSMGLQLALVIIGSWIAWSLMRGSSEVGPSVAARGAFAFGLAVLPGLAINLSQGGTNHLLQGLSPEDLWTLAVELQGPQHMLPHLWRMPQWLAWGCYPLLAVLSLAPTRSVSRSELWSPARFRLVLMLAVILLGLGAAWVAIERWHHLRITLFQPFRMATLARGLCLVLIAGRLVRLWNSGTAPGRVRAVSIVAGLSGDWSFVVVTLVELGVTIAGRLSEKIGRKTPGLVFAGLMACGLTFLARHDTASGHGVLVAALGTGLLLHGLDVAGRMPTPGRWKARLAAAWTVPVLALMAGLVPEEQPLARTSVVRALVQHCRFAPRPVTDVERLADWCRTNTPITSRFVGPPGPKTLRLWSRRSLAFNRAGSPYHAAGLADWFARFQDHVDLHEPPAEFVRSYLSGRHGLEERFDRLNDDELAALAFRQGADHIVARSSRGGNGRLEELHAEGRYAVYRVRSEASSVSQRQQ
jgi:hypothetical protein